MNESGVASPPVAAWGESTRPHMDHTVSVEYGSSASGPVERGWDARLVLRRGPDAGAGFVITAARTTIGRDRASDITFDDATVSRQHAEVHRVGDRYVIADAGSLNGTYVNRQPVERAELNEGDEIWVGKMRLTFHARADGHGATRSQNGPQ
jgi:predicted component of type VI protein secretion system